MQDTTAAKAHVNCRVEIKISPRNDNLEARHAILAVTVGASACGAYACVFFFKRAKGILHH